MPWAARRSCAAERGGESVRRGSDSSADEAANRFLIIPIVGRQADSFCCWPAGTPRFGCCRLVCLFMLPGSMPPLTYRWFMGIHDYPRYTITAPTAICTVGNGVFAITNGRKWRDRRSDVPWVMPFLPLPTVGNGVAGGRMYRGFCRFCRYQR